MRYLLALTLPLALPVFAERLVGPPPRIWNDQALAEWATPVAGLNIRPGHFSEGEYYAAPVAEAVRTYPVYLPGREPHGYFEALQTRRPEPLVVPGARTGAEWAKVGKTVFRELDTTLARSYSPELIAMARSAEALRQMGARAQPDGTIAGLRWVPTSKGLALSVTECSGCHTRVMPDGSSLDGAPGNAAGNGLLGQLIDRAFSILFNRDSRPLMNWRMFAVPWAAGDIHEGLKTMEAAELSAVRRGVITGTIARMNGSPYYPTKIPDLIGIGERRFLDHTATHRLRDSGDLMRYAALVGCCDSMDFGPHRMLSDAQRKIHDRHSDEVLFALAEYIYSLTPPASPHRDAPGVAEGRRIFARERCAACHTPPYYSNNKLTLAEGYRPPPDHPLSDAILPVSVGTHPGLALHTRKGTGFYKVPSLKGLWYRGLYGHDGSVASLEDWFDPARRREDYVPSGFRGPKTNSRPVPGHEFGLRLPARDKAALIAFLKTL